MSASETFSILVGAVLDRIGIRYFTLRKYRVEKQNADFTLELKPVPKDGLLWWPGSDKLPPDQQNDMPGLSNVRIWTITPGTTIKVKPGSYCMVGFQNGDPGKRYALSIWDNAGGCPQMVLASDDLQLGGQATEAAMLGTTFRADLTSLHNALLTDLAATDTVVATAAAGALDPSVKAAFVKIKTLLLNWQVNIGKIEAASKNHTSTIVKVKK